MICILLSSLILKKGLNECTVGAKISEITAAAFVGKARETKKPPLAMVLM
jgi:hypothetical protein